MAGEKLYRDLEREKYLRVWSGDPPHYRDQNDGMPWVEEAFQQMGCQPGETLIDWGTGSGQSAEAFQKLGLKVTGFDIADNCLNEGIDIPLVVGCLWEPPPKLSADYAFCTDVLEHIPPDYIDQCLDTLRERSTKAAALQVDTAQDISGDRMRPPARLHLCIRPGKWWEQQLQARWQEVVKSDGESTRFRFICRP